MKSPKHPLKLFRILLKWKYMQDKNYAILVAMLQKRSYFLLKGSSRSSGLKCSYGKNLIPVTGLARLIMGVFTKERVARWYLGNRVSPVDRAHTKRPLEMSFLLLALTSFGMSCKFTFAQVVNNCSFSFWLGLLLLMDLNYLLYFFMSDGTFTKTTVFSKSCVPQLVFLATGVNISTFETTLVTREARTSPNLGPFQTSPKEF